MGLQQWRPCAGAGSRQTAGTGTPAVLKQRQQFFVTLLCGADGLVAALACYAAWAVRRATIERAWPTPPATAETWWDVVSPWVHEPLAFLCVPITLLAMWNFGLYRPRRDRGMMAEHGQVFRASLAAIIALVVLIAALGTEFVGGWGPTGRVHLAGMWLD